MMPKEINNQIVFCIENLEGVSFSVSIPRVAAERFYRRPGMWRDRNPYAKYGLDILQEAICKINGVDPVSQQLIAEEALTISTPLIPLENKVLTLIIIPPFSIDISQKYISYHQINANIDWLGRQSYYPETAIGWLLSDYINEPLFVVGIMRDYFKIKGINIPNSLLFNVEGPFRNTTQLPEYVWLQYDKNCMKIPPPNICPFLYN
jgi:hypothetical protein